LLHLFIDLERRILRRGLNCHLHVRTAFEAYLIAVFIRQSFVDAEFPVQVVAPSTEICAFSGSSEYGDLMIFSTVPGRMVLDFSVIFPLRGECR